MSHGGTQPPPNRAARRRVRTAGIAVVLLVAGATTSASAAPTRRTAPANPASEVVLSEAAPRPDGAAADKLEQDYPRVDYLRLSPSELVNELVTSIQPEEVDPETSCQALVPRDNAVEVDGASLDFQGAEASICDPGEGSYLAWHGQRRNADDDVLASISLSVIFDEDGNATGATGTIQTGSAGYVLMPVEGDTYSLAELGPSKPDGEPIMPDGDEGPGSTGPGGSTTTTQPSVTTTEPSEDDGGATTSTTVVPGDVAPGGGNPQPIAGTPDSRTGVPGDSVADAEPGDIDGGQPRPGGPPGNRTIQVRFAYTSGITANQAYLYLVNRTEQTNDAFINSNMPVRVEGMGPESAGYTQSSSMLADLYRLQDPGDGHMDGLLAHFDSTTNDALALLVPNINEGTCGRGFLSNEVHANVDFLSISTVASGCDLTVPHELGHNFSAHHNPENAGGTTAFPWSYGHYSYGHASDVMTYEASVCGTQCPRKLQWSDPDNSFVGHPGTPSGTPYRDNDRSITDTSWAASQKGNTSSNDHIWYRSASSHSSFNVPNDVEAPYSPLSGDFDGDGNSDQFWYFPGRPIEHLWAFYPVTGSHDDYPLDVVGNYRPVAGDFDGDGRDDILWHAPGSEQDSIWWGTAVSNDFGSVVTNLSVSGSYIPQSGDIDGDGRDDIVWYAPGTANDYIWWGHATRSTFAGGSGSSSITVNGTYHLTLGDHNGDGRDDLSWFLPGTGADFLWHGMATRSAVGSSNQSNYTVDGQRTPKAGDFNGDGRDDIFWYGPGSEPDSIWWGQATMSAFASGSSWTSQTVNGTFSPTTGDFDGDEYTDLFWFSFG